MDTLDKTDWDVLIVGTGLQQSLLALALSRSDKKILHIDENDYYGGAEAAFSLQEAEQWVEKVNAGDSAAFSHASVQRPAPASSAASLSPSRAYSLALSPQIIYARSALIKYLISSRVYRQLEFMAVGSWWVFSPETGDQDASPIPTPQPSRPGKLLKVPNGREDVFQDHDLEFKAKRALMKFLRFVAEYEEQAEIWDEHRTRPFTMFLSEQFKIPPRLQAPFLALSLSNASLNLVTTEYALPRVARHLRSIGALGAGFGAIVPKWGGMSEVSQVGCRASAVGGAVYVLGKSLGGNANTELGDSESTTLRLKDGEVITARWVVGESSKEKVDEQLCRSIAIVSSPLTSLFPPIADEAPPPATAIVFFPSGSLSLSEPDQSNAELPPVYIHIHSSDTSECPRGQSVLYGSTSLPGNTGLELLRVATETLLASVTDADASVLYSIQYQQQTTASNSPLSPGSNDHILNFTPPPLDQAFDDSILDRVKDVWQQITDDDHDSFLVFADREVYDDDE
ncbi:rab geranylgeranyl transferase escort protein-like protein [Periconia macrospinosa]|uniref:Rab proteins geranylgeranyltransferase n=1 Tax=Periconia macrospinosa TaxID=97972 RepID=A0A2V1E7A5_9PLEO|nr:rab geranylgeranyl transferase escort protein-like protein [Periconia macrospinosa]